VQAVGEPDGVRGWVGPSHQLVGVVHDPAGPEEPLGVLGDQPVELILLGRGVQGYGLHPHGVAVGLGFVLLEGSASNLPCDNIPLPVPEVVGSSCATLACSASNAVLRGLEGGWLRLRLSDYLGLSWLGLEYWGLLEGSLADWSLLGLELLLWLLELGLLRLGLEELLLLLGLELLLLLLKLLWSCWSRSWSVITPTKEIVKCACDPRKEAILGMSQRQGEC